MSQNESFDPTMGKFIDVEIDKEMKKSFLDYSMSVIMSRALPDVRDGLKPVHRRIIYAMWEHNLFYDRPFHKCADTVGNVLGSYHPHGDSSVYDALVRLAQDFSLRYPLVDGHGNFGSIDGDPAAHYRYTEARMSRISMEMLTDINKDTVDFQDNYDNRLQEPIVLPSRIPNLLINGSAGIAVGMATNIPPHNLNEVIDGIFLLLENEQTSIERLIEKIPGPDFPTGGIIMGRAGIRAAYVKGRGKVVVRCLAHIEETSNKKSRIVVSELPYQVNKARLIESIANHVKNKVVEGISGLRDESGRDGMRIVIELKQNANAQIVLNKLYRYTQMQDTFGIINLALVDGVPKVLNLKQMLEHYINHQKNVIVRRTQFDLKKASEREHILKGLRVAIDFIDKVIALIRSSKTISEAKEKLMNNFTNLDETQVEAIVKMRLGQLAGLEREKIEQEFLELSEKIKYLKQILESETRVKEILIEELTALKNKFGDERRTKIEEVAGEVDIEDLIPNLECALTLTNYGYIKRQPLSFYKTQKRGGRGINGLKHREEDFVENLFVGFSHDFVIFLTNRGLMFSLKCYEIPEGGKNSKGTNLVNLINLSEDEKVNSLFCISKFDENNFLIFVTKNGIIKRTRLDAYQNVRKNGLIAISLDADDYLIGTILTNGNEELLIATKNGMAIRISEKSIRPLSRSARGVVAIKLKDSDEVVGAVKIIDNANLITISTNGIGRRTKFSDYRIQNRRGFGVLNYKIDDRKGYVAKIGVVNENDNLIIISSEGVMIRIKACEVSLASRYSGGVRLMKLKENDRVVSLVATSASDDDNDEDNNNNEEKAENI